MFFVFHFKQHENKKVHEGVYLCTKLITRNGVFLFNNLDLFSPPMAHAGYMDLLARSNYGINNDITPLFGNLVNDSLSSSGTDFSLWIEKQLLAPDKSEDSALRLTTSALLLRPGTYGEDFNASSTNSTTIFDSCQATWSKLFEPDWAESSDFSLPPTYNVFFWQILCICWEIQH